VMVLLLSLAADRRPGRGAGRFPGSAAWFAALAVVAGGALELLQHLTGRDTQLLDWVADGVGAAIGLWGWVLINRRWTARVPAPRVGTDRR
jgi:VanZ family protein